MSPNSYTPLHRASPPPRHYLAASPADGLICSSAWDIFFPRVMDKHPDVPGALPAARDATLSEFPPPAAYCLVGKVGRMCAPREAARRAVQKGSAGGQATGHM